MTRPNNTTSRDALDDNWVEELVGNHTSTVAKWLKKGRTIGEAYAEANREAKAAILKLIETQVQDARIDELTRTIAYFDDEGRESRDVLHAFRNHRLAELNSQQTKPGGTDNE